MKALETLLVNIEENIATITIKRPKALNAINNTVMEEFGYLFSEGLDMKALHGIIITGSGNKAFVAGADIKGFPMGNREKGEAVSRFGHGVYNSIEQCPVPVLAAINGYSLGGGNELAMACHMRICSDNAKFGQPEVNLGLVPGYGGSQRLIQLIGKGRAMQMLLTADMIDATKALDYGLVTHVTSPETLMEVANKIIKKIATKGPYAIAETIAAVNAFFDKTTDGFETEMVSFGKTMGSAEGEEGVEAFMAKRKAEFRKG